jgi:hypothetical protein
MAKQSGTSARGGHDNHTMSPLRSVNWPSPLTPPDLAYPAAVDFSFSIDLRQCAMSKFSPYCVKLGRTKASEVVAGPKWVAITKKTPAASPSAGVLCFDQFNNWLMPEASLIKPRQAPV